VTLNVVTSPGLLAILSAVSGPGVVERKTLEAFRRRRSSGQGRQLWAPDVRVALERYGATRCRHPADPFELAMRAARAQRRRGR
jgi:hypothetical protein